MDSASVAEEVSGLQPDMAQGCATADSAGQPETAGRQNPGILEGARGRSLTYTSAELNPVLRGWAAYFKLTETKNPLEERDGWIRHKLRCIQWRQWKRPYTRAKNLMKAGLTEERAFRSAFNQRGPWWNSGASHMNQAFPKSFFDRLGLVSLLDTMRRLQCVQ